MALRRAEAKALLPKIEAECGSALELLLRELIHDGNLAVFGVDATISEIDGGDGHVEEYGSPAQAG